MALAVTALLAGQGAAAALAAPGAEGRGADPGPVATAKAGAGTVAAKAATALGGVGAKHLVTLVTGDRLETFVRADGTLSATLAPGARRPGVAFAEKTVPGPGGTRDLVVVPSDAAAGLASGALDERLFDVSELIRDGYDDASRASLPLIVAYQGSGSTLLHAAALVRGGAVAGRELPSIGGGTLEQPRASARSVWAALTAATTAKGRSAVRPGTGRGVAPDIAHVWLDGKVRAADDVSGPQIGAPAAYQAGYTGSGVLVADLDTGYDQNHPDLAGVVAQAQDFSGSATGVQDMVGHGTHTASIIAGSGAASGGEYRGVAYGAKLLIGKVLGDDGSGDYSQIIAGMQWAADQHAKVVNMSLGAFLGCDPGTDPISVALDSLSASSGALFVVAAGNDGAGGSVEAPGVADAALTVGAVDAGDRIAFFSSAGPRCPDDAVKPDITAPGVGIAAARAAGTSLGQNDGISGDGPIDANYTRATGTSMATPHVTGAAAILAQQHPDWTGQQLKYALMDSAKPTAALSPFAQGDGRVDIGRAVGQSVTASPGSISRFLSWPHTAPDTTSVTYTNAGSSPQTLGLSLSAQGADGAAAPTGMFALGESSVTVPARGSVQVLLSIDAAKGAPGLYSGRITAASSDGSTALQTAIGAFDEPESHTLTLRALDRNGSTVLPLLLQVVNVATGAAYLPAEQPDGSLTVRVPDGGYEVSSVDATYGADSSQLQSIALAESPDVAVGQDTAVVQDVRSGVPIQATVDRPVGNALYSATFSETIAGATFGLEAFGQDLPVYATPTAQVTDRPFEAFIGADFDNSPTRANQLATLTYSLLFSHPGSIPDQLTYHAHDADLAVLHERFDVQAGQPFSSVDTVHFPQPGADALAQSEPFSEFSLDPSAASTELLTPARWINDPAMLIGSDWAQGGTQEMSPIENYLPGHVYRTVWDQAALAPASTSARFGDVIATMLYPASDSAPGTFSYDNSDNGIAGTVTLSQGSTVIGVKDVNDMPEFDVPPSTAAYQLSLSETRTAPWTNLATRVNAVWGFHSGHADSANGQMLPLWTVRISGGFDGAGRAPAGVPFRLTVAPDLPQGAPSAPITAVRVAASFDDGATWHALVLHSDGKSRWTTVLNAPATASFVSLEADLTDAAGDSVHQTVIHAYGLRPKR